MANLDDPVITLSKALHDLHEGNIESAKSNINWAIRTLASRPTPLAADLAEQQQNLDVAQASYIPGNIGSHKTPTR